jgi:hypothetical protein
MMDTSTHMLGEAISPSLVHAFNDQRRTLRKPPTDKNNTSNMNPALQHLLPPHLLAQMQERENCKCQFHGTLQSYQ